MEKEEDLGMKKEERLTFEERNGIRKMVFIKDNGLTIYRSTKCIIEFDNKETRRLIKWLLDNLSDNTEYIRLKYAIIDILSKNEEKTYRGTVSELCSILRNTYGCNYIKSPDALGRKLSSFENILLTYDIKIFRYIKRKEDKKDRIIEIRKL